MKWIKTCNGQFINLDHVAQFSFLRGSDLKDHQLRMHIEYSGERSETHVIYKSDYADIEEMIINQHNQFCPSPPGYFVLSYYKEDEDSEEIVVRDAILGWVLDTDLDGYHHVVTTWDNHKTFDPTTAILCADGTVVVPGSSRYEDEESWLKEMRARPVDKAA
jgi:hypothetical protein